MNKIILTCLISFIMVSSITEVSAQGLLKTIVAVTGNVIDHTTKEPVSAKITVYNEAGEKVNSTKSNAFEDGYYYVTSLSAGTTYDFVIENDDYLLERVSVRIAATDKYEEISRDFVLKPKKIGEQLKLPVSPFELNKSKLRFGSAIIIEDMATTLKNNKDVKFKIVSFPDEPGNPEANHELTQSRAQSLMDYLVIRGIDPDRILIEGKSTLDSKNPPPTEKQSKGKRYIGPTYIEIISH